MYAICCYKWLEIKFQEFFKTVISRNLSIGYTMFIDKENGNYIVVMSN